MDIMNFIQEHFMILIPVLWIIGIGLRNSKKVKNELLILILIAISVPLAFWIDGINPNSLMQGILAVAGAVILHEIPKNLLKLRGSKLAEEKLKEIENQEKSN